MSRETKTLSFQVKDLGIMKDASGQEFGQIEAYGAMFNNVDDGGDRILPGAFKRTLKSAKDRATSRQKKYLAPMLWQHDTHEVIGGWYELSETDTGLLGKGDISLATQRGREYYALAKAGMSDEFSIIYDIPSGGAHYDKSGVRDLTEMRLFSIDPVTFAMNDATFVVNVKGNKASGNDGGSSVATVIGNTKGPIGPRDEAWDGGKAEGQIWAAAYDDDSGKIDEPLAKKYFMLLDGDPQNKTSYSYPFWYVGSDPHISVGAVKAIAGALSGSRGADAPDGLKPKVETLYKRINAKYPDDPQLTPPWQSDEKARGRGTMQRKTFADHLNDDQCRDLLNDWHDVIIHAFTCAVLDAFTIGDQPEADVSDALKDFQTAVMAWVEQGVQCGLSDYLDEQGGNWSPGEYPMQYGSYSLGYLSRNPLAFAYKAMTAGDATTGGFTAGHVDKLKGAADKAMKAVDKHVSALTDAAASVKALIGNASSGGEKAGRAFSAANAQALSDHADALTDAANSHQKAMSRQMKAINSVADDLATVLQGSESAYGTDPGDAGDHQEGKNRNDRNDSVRTPSHHLLTRAPHTPPSQRKSADDTVSEDDVAGALAKLRKLRTPA